MKSIKTLAILTAALALTIAPAALAQNSDTATADANATIIAAIAVSNTASLEFGDIVQDATGGTVTVSPTGVLASSGPHSLGGEQAAAYTVTGDASKTFGITFGAPSITITGPAAATMTVDTFAASCSSGCALTGGSASLTTGARLTVGANQTPGAYNGTFDLTVSYE